MDRSLIPLPADSSVGLEEKRAEEAQEAEYRKTTRLCTDAIYRVSTRHSPLPSLQFTNYKLQIMNYSMHPKSFTVRKVNKIRIYDLSRDRLERV